jgi:purine nucleoside phosphorylase
MAAGVLSQKLTHKEVLEAAEASEETFQSLLRGIISRLADIPNTIGLH